MNKIVYLCFRCKLMSNIYGSCRKTGNQRQQPQYQQDKSTCSVYIKWRRKERREATEMGPENDSMLTEKQGWVRDVDEDSLKRSR